MLHFPSSSSPLPHLSRARTPSRSRPKKRAVRCWCDDNDATGSVWRCVFFHWYWGDAYDIFISGMRIHLFSAAGGWMIWRDIQYFSRIIFPHTFLLPFRLKRARMMKKGKILLSCVPGFSLCYKFFPSRLSAVVHRRQHQLRRRPPPFGKSIVWYGGRNWIKELSLKTEKCCARTISMCEATGWGCYVEPMSHNIDWFLMMLSFNGESQEIL